MSYFITVEGPEGSGKSTIVKAIESSLSKDFKVMTTREPGGIKISEDIRSILLDDANTMDYRTEALLFAASRRQHLVEKVLPALNQGTIVVCDRFIDSSLAYQGYARGIEVKEIREINEFAIEGKYPDLTLYLRVEPEIGLARISENAREMNRLDKEKIDFHQRVVDGYDALLALHPERIKLIDASQSVEDVLEQCLQTIYQCIR
ncbi:dTMP kinase [Macrococcoides caseolyticum]|uniref:dTMP kinase n=1 Tax=Macrococcoides caseolyticum TaxID=69966 RepID=UPI001F3405CC|nr:dTMP kinase [Macrococcus caseolyticus]MCE4957926.1 dTMP kinase [Macrococcus caseolyticus]